MSEKRPPKYLIIGSGEPVLVGKRHGGVKNGEDSRSDTYSGALPSPERGWTVERGEQEAMILCDLVRLAYVETGSHIRQSGYCTTALGGMVVNAMRNIAAERGCEMEISFPAGETAMTRFTFSMKDGGR